MGLGIFDPLLRGEVGDLGGSVFDAPTDAESVEMSALTGVGILETGRGILLLLLPPDWSDTGRSPKVVAVGVGAEIVVERLLWF